MSEHNHGFDPEDPRLSAFALGELEGPERAEIEALLERSAEARRFVEELRATASGLAAELRAETDGHSLGASGQQALSEATAPRRRPRVTWGFSLVAAAALVLGMVLILDPLGEPVDEKTTPETALSPRSSANQWWDSRETKAPTTPPPLPVSPSTIYLGRDPGGAGGGGGLQVDSRTKLAVLESLRVARNREVGAAAFRVRGELRQDGEESKSRALEELDTSTEGYDHLPENDFIPVGDAPLSTFSIDVDTASYANLRRFLEHGQKPPKGSIRIEELVNYFHYEDPAPTGELPFTATLEVAQCPWKLEHRLVRIGLKGREIPTEQRPASNLVFLLDVSGSMQPDNKLPLLKRAMRLLVDSLGENDRVAIVVYAGASGLALPSTSCANKETIRRALEELSAGGSTNGAAGIQLAYQTAVANFISGGLNRVILCTDGDFNVGVSDRSSLVELIQEKARSGVFLSVLGFGMGNIKDGNLEALADKGNGNYAYIDGLEEARKVLVREMGATLIAIAKDVKIQIEFNPARVAAYRLIGYENRLLAAKDFNDDTKDAGEIGAGTSVTALYELVPTGAPVPTLSTGTEPLRYQRPMRLTEAATSAELMCFRLRYKEPDEDVSRLIETTVQDRSTSFDRASRDLRFAAAVAAFGMILRESQYRGGATLETVDELARDALGADPHGDRAGFLQLVNRARGNL